MELKTYRAAPKPYTNKIWDLRDPKGIDGKRWNSAGKQLIYTSESLAGVYAELSMYVTSVKILQTYEWGDVEFDDSLVLNMTELKEGWKDDFAYTQKIGDLFIEQNELLAMKVPSAVIDKTFNYLINPLHAQYSNLQKQIQQGTLLSHPTYVN